MIIAGGTYYEECQFPPDGVLFGSGLRAAVATQTRTPSRNQLHTCIGSGDQEKLETYSNTFGFDVHATEISETVTFDYLHNHSNSQIIPNEAPAYDATLSRISGDAVLRFGLIEGTAVVSGERVVYDPQAKDPARFNANDSTAEELALVLNCKEAAQLSGEAELEPIFEELMSGSEGADVVVIKRGPRGAIVRTHGMTTMVPVYQTESVWGIGSGDVFSAVFAAEWAENMISAREAAVSASKATAYYCRHRQLSTPTELVDSFISSTPSEFISPAASEPTIYLAGPFFDIGERYLVEEVKHLLEGEGVEIVSPVHDIGLATDYDNTEDVASQDLEAIEQSDLVFALLDHQDSGTHFELGYARKIGIPVVGYADDYDPDDYTMITGAGCEIYGDLASAIYNAIWRAYA